MHPVGFVGTGFHARTNLLPAASLAGVAIIGLASRDAERSAVTLAHAGFEAARPYGSVRDLVADLPHLDRVIVCAQPSDQPGIVDQLIEAGMHVLAEKPLGLDAGEAKALADHAASRGVALRVAFMKRYAPAVRALDELLTAAELGEMLSFEVRFGADAGGFAPTPADFIRLAAIHHVDLVRHLFGDVERVDVAFSGTAVACTVLVTLRMRSGAVGTLHLSDGPGHTSELDVTTITCERGTVTMTDTRELVVHRGAAGGTDWRRPLEQRTVMEPAVSTMSGGAQDLVLRGFVDEIESFAADDLNGEDPSAQENVRTMELVDAIIRQLPSDRTAGATAGAA